MINAHCVSALWGLGDLYEFVVCIVSNVVVSRPVAEKAVWIIFDFLSKDGPADKVHTLLDRLPGAADAIAAARADESGGMFGGMGRGMGVGKPLISAGLGLGALQGATPEPIPLSPEQARPAS